MLASRVSLVVALACATAFAEQPSIVSVSPSQGPIAGGTVVIVRGSNLTDVRVTLGGAEVTPLSRTDAELRLQTPPHDNGYVVIAARNAAGAAYGEFLYVPPPLHELPPGFMTTVAGIGAFTRDYGPAREATLQTPWALSIDSAGRLYIGDAAAGSIYRVGTDGVIERVAGGGAGPELADGIPATDAYLSYPRSAVTDSAGNIYIGSNACRLQKVGPNGVITTVAGDGVCGFSGDGGPASAARIGSPTFLAIDEEDLFFVDYTYVVGPAQDSQRDAVRIRRVHLSDGTISTFAGDGQIGFSGDTGPATQASFDFGERGVDAGALALDPDGNVYIADAGNRRIRRVDRATGVINTFHALATDSPFGEGEVIALSFDRDGNLYYAASRIVKISPTGEFLTFWGNGSYALPVDGIPAATAGLGHNLGLAIDGAGNIIYSDDAIMRVRRINIATGLLETVAGIGPAIIGENGPAIASAAAAEATDLEFAPDGSLLIGDAGAFRVRRLEPDGTLRTIGGTGSFVGSFDDGVPATTVSMHPVGIYADGTEIDVTERAAFKRIDAAGNVFHRGHRIDCGYSGDGGDMRDADFCQAWDLARDAAGNLFIADTNNNRIRRVDGVTNVVTTYAGNGGPVSGFERYGFGQTCGDGGPAIDACINTPYGIAFDGAGTLYFSEMGGIRKIDSGGVVSTLAVTQGFFATKLWFDRGFIYTAGNGGVWRYDRFGNATRIAGGGTGSLLGDGGPALAARLLPGGQGNGVAVDGEGNVFVVDTYNRRIRAIRFGAVLAPPDASVAVTASGGTIRATVQDRDAKAAPSVRVDFTVPASGASCFLSSSFAVTDESGQATVSCTPNCRAGTYSVTAQPTASPAVATVTLTNAGQPCRRRAVRR